MSMNLDKFGLRYLLDVQVKVTSGLLVYWSSYVVAKTERNDIN